MLVRCAAMAFCFLLTVGWIAPVSQAEEKGQSEQVAQPALRDALLARMKVDQKIRFKMIKWAQENNISLGAKDDVLKLEAPVIREMMRIDKENREWLEGVIKKHGWPGKSLVGVEAAHAAWLLVQHADHDRPFQKQCLQEMQHAAAGEVAGTDIAYLVDRVRVGEGKKQLYGTQAKQVDGRWTVEDVEDPGNLDQRRAKMGMPSLEEYLKLIEQVYSQQTKPGRPQ